MKGTFWYQDYFDLPKLFFLFLSLQYFTLSTERRHHHVHILFDELSYDVRSAHWHGNNKIYSVSVSTMKIFISCNENIQIFPLTPHS